MTQTSREIRLPSPELTANTDWRDRAYGNYVSSGQSSVDYNLESPFRSRRPHILSIIKRHIPQDRNQVIVDLGCGSGAYLYFLRERGYTDLRGVDISTEQVDLAHKLGLMSVERNSIEAYAASLPNHSVDVILLMDVLEHMGRQEIFFLLDNVIRILKPGGRCLLHVPNAEGLFGMRVR